MKLKNFNVVDLFCGLGGSSQGLLHFLMASGYTPEWMERHGYRLSLHNINHWEPAIETIRRNIAFAQLYNAKIQDVDPSYTLRGERPHFVITSPECIMYSRSRGDRPIKDQSRTTAAWVLAFFFENVEDWQTWGPLNASMRPIPEHKGEFFHGFLRALRQHGYDLRHQVVRCDEFGDATIRKRLFILGMLKTVMHEANMGSISFPEPTHTATPQKHPHRQPRRVARDIINWTLKGRPITHRLAGPHAVPTLSRIRAGFAKQTALLAPCYVEIIDRLIPIAEAFHCEMSAITTEKRNGRKPTREKQQANQAIRERARSKAHAAVVTAYQTPIAHFSAQDFTDSDTPLAMTLGQHGGATAHLENEPIATIAVKGALALVEATSFIVKANASATSTFQDDTQSLAAPLNTIVTKDCRALAEPMIAQLYSANVAHGGTDSVADPLSTITSGGIHQALVEPFIATIYGATTTSDRRTTDLDTPLSTIVAGGKHHALAAPILACVQHGKDDQRSTSIHEPVPTVTSKNGTGLAEPIIVPQQSSAGLRSIDEPIPTTTTIARIGLAQAFITPNFGERATQEPRAHSVAQPIPTITSHGAGMLNEPVFCLPEGGPFILIDGVPFGINILYRMLRSSELAAAHSIENVVLPTCEQDAVKLIGNSIPKLTAAALIGHILSPIFRSIEAGVALERCA
ncbi:MAG: DNA cytosine methyltransferase [Bacillati bacterium]